MKQEKTLYFLMEIKNYEVCIAASAFDKRTVMKIANELRDVQQRCEKDAYYKRCYIILTEKKLSKLIEILKSFKI